MRKNRNRKNKSSPKLLLRIPENQKLTVNPQFSKALSDSKSTSLSTAASYLIFMLLNNVMHDENEFKPTILLAIQLITFSSMALTMYHSLCVLWIHSQGTPLIEIQNPTTFSLIENPKALRKHKKVQPRRRHKKPCAPLTPPLTETDAQKPRIALRSKPSTVQPSPSRAIDSKQNVPVNNTVDKKKIAPIKTSVAKGTSRRKATTNDMETKKIRARISQRNMRRKQAQQEAFEEKQRRKLQFELRKKRDSAARILQKLTKNILFHKHLKQAIQKRKKSHITFALEMVDHILVKALKTATLNIRKKDLHQKIQTPLIHYKKNHTTTQTAFTQLEEKRALQLKQRYLDEIRHSQNTSATAIQKTVRRHQAQQKLKIILTALHCIQSLFRKRTIYNAQVKAASLIQRTTRTYFKTQRLLKKQHRELITDVVDSLINYALRISRENAAVTYLPTNSDHQTLWSALHFSQPLPEETLLLINYTLVFFHQHNYRYYINGRMSLYPQDTYNGLDLMALPEQLNTTNDLQILLSQLHYQLMQTKCFTPSSFNSRHSHHNNKNYSQLIHSSPHGFMTYITIRNNTVWHELNQRSLNHNRGLRALYYDQDNLIRIDRCLVLSNENSAHIQQKHLTTNQLSSPLLPTGSLLHLIKDISRCHTANQELINLTHQSLIRVLSETCTSPFEWKSFTEKALMHWKIHSLQCYSFISSLNPSYTLTTFLDHLIHYMQMPIPTHESTLNEGQALQSYSSLSVTQ